MRVGQAMIVFPVASCWTVETEDPIDEMVSSMYIPSKDLKLSQRKGGSWCG